MLRKFQVTGLLAAQSFNWNGGNYRQFDPLEADTENTNPEALRHLLHPDEGGYPDSLMARQVVTETLPKPKKSQATVGIPPEAKKE